MEKPIFTSFSPNVEGDDIVRSLFWFLAPWKWRRGAYVQKIEKEFRGRFGVRHAYAFESGRSALYAILKHIDLKDGDEVIIQAFTCVAVPNAVLWAGAMPVYADIDPATLNMPPENFEKKITAKTRAVIVQHTFGFPADMEKIMPIARKHNIFVIEDCAHALGGTYGGKMLGTLGDAAMFSFGRDKVISSVFGGVAITNNDILGKKLAQFQRSLPEARMSWIAKQTIHPAFTAFLRSTHCKCAGRIGRVFLRMALGLGLITRAMAGKEKRGEMPGWVLRKMPNTLAAFAWHQLHKLERFNEHRKKTAFAYRKLLPDLAMQSDNPGALYLRYALYVNNPEKVLTAAKKRDIFLGDWYREGIAPAGVDYKAIRYNPAECPEAERAAKKIINLPTNTHIMEAHVERIVNFLKKAL